MLSLHPFHFDDFDLVMSGQGSKLRTLNLKHEKFPSSESNENKMRQDTVFIKQQSSSEYIDMPSQ